MIQFSSSGCISGCLGRLVRHHRRKALLKVASVWSLTHWTMGLIISARGVVEGSATSLALQYSLARSSAKQLPRYSLGGRSVTVWQKPQMFCASAFVYHEHLVMSLGVVCLSPVSGGIGCIGVLPCIYKDALPSLMFCCLRLMTARACAWCRVHKVAPSRTPFHGVGVGTAYH